MKRFYSLAAISVLILGCLCLTGCGKKAVANVPEEEYLKASEIGALAEPIRFDFDSSVIKPEYECLLKHKAHVLKENSKIAIVVEGNCDERGTKAYNKALGERRAKAVESFLVQEGVDPAKIKIVSLGEENPAAEGHSEDVYQLNRRDDFHIYIR